MPTKQDYYEILEIPRTANDEEIKKAFRRLAFKYHPDHNRDGGAADKFKEINEAYQVLSDPNKRAAYDQFGHGGNEGFHGRGFEGFEFGGFGDIFEAFFGGTAGNARRSPQRGNDLTYNTYITFEEAAFGAEREINIRRTEGCSACQGSGSRPGTQPEKCSSCNGSGQVRRVQQSIFGRFANIATCPDCRGQGRIITDPCPQCRGTGKQKQERRISVKIPAGVDNGTQIRLSAEGEVGERGGHPGDLYVSLSVKPHELFDRNEDDIIYELPLNFAQAALGAEIEIPTLEGSSTLNLKAGRQTGEVFKLKNKGIPHLRGRGRGDQYIRLRVVTPDSLTKKQRQLLKELEETLEPKSKKAA
ncbi:molecular chaperone DnaJ [Chloroflexota bacterium]